MSALAGTHVALVVEPTCTPRALSRRDFVASGVVLGLEPGGTTGVAITPMEIQTHTGLGIAVLQSPSGSLFVKLFIQSRLPENRFPML